MPTRSGRGAPLRGERLRQFQEVVGRADETPLPRDLPQPPEQELSKTAGLFDLPEHGFDDLLAQPVATALRRRISFRRMRVSESRRWSDGLRRPTPGRAVAARWRRSR